MRVYESNSFSEVYGMVRKDLLEVASEASPRGMKTKEISPAVICMHDPRNRLMYNSHRKFNLPFAVSEAILFFGNTTLLEFYSRYNKNVEQFSDDGKLARGAYGPRIYRFIEDAVNKLKKDPDTRQAVINIYNAADDIKVVTKDVPCTLTLQLLIRNNKLDLIMNMRSNDFIWGTPYDIFVFTIFQEVIANELKREVGNYYHIMGSLHVYEYHFKLLEEIETGQMIRFNVGYNLQDMKALNKDYIWAVMKEDIKGISTGDDLFREILYRKEMKTRSIELGINFMSDEYIKNKWIIKYIKGIE